MAALENLRCRARQIDSLILRRLLRAWKEFEFPCFARGGCREPKDYPESSTAQKFSRQRLPLFLRFYREP